MRFHPTTLLWLPLAMSAPAVASMNPSPVEPGVAATEATEATGAADDLFPMATGPLEIVVGEDGNGPSFLELIQQYGKLTGQHVTFSALTRELLTNTSVQLDRSLTAPPAEAQRAFEVLMRQGNFSLEIESASAPRILRVRSLETGERNDLRSTASRLPMERIEVARNHPAMQFSVAVDMPNTDVRQLSNSLRAMITDANTSMILPAGNSHSILVSGFGDWVHEHALMLRSVDEAAARREAERERAVVVLSTAKAAVVAEALTEAFTDRTLPESLQVRIRANEESNSILLHAPVRRIAAIRRVIEALDR